MASATRIVDVCGVVQALFREIEQRGGVIKPPIEVKVIQKAVAERLPLYQGRRQIIVLRGKKWRSLQVWGILTRYADHSQIQYSLEPNTCWRRLILFKEMAQLLIDRPATDFTKDPESLVQQLITDAPSLGPDCELDSERFAMYAAFEMLLPWQLRPAMEGMVAEGLSDLKIAQMYRCPEKVVNFLLRSKYGERSKLANTQAAAATVTVTS